MGKGKGDLVPQVSWRKVVASSVSGVPWAIAVEMEKYISLFFYEMAAYLAHGNRVELPQIGQFYVLPTHNPGALNVIKKEKTDKEDTRQMYGKWKVNAKLKGAARKNYGSVWKEENTGSRVRQDYFPKSARRRGIRLELPEIDLQDLLWEEQ